MSLVLLAPHARRPTNVLLLGRPAQAAAQQQLFTTRRANRIATGVQIALGLWVLAGCLLTGWQGWYEYGGGRPDSALHGIWSVTEFTLEGSPRPPLTTDEDRWQRVVFDEPGVVTYQRMNGELVSAPAQIDTGARTVMLAAPPNGSAGPQPFAEFTFERPDPDNLRLDGQLDGQRVTMSLQRVDPNSFTLRNRGFNWVQKYPYFT